MRTIQCVDSSNVNRLAKRLEEDIRVRRLCVGDRYFTAAEVATKLGVSVTTAHRALKCLADRRLLLRRRNSGTFIGPAGAMKKTDKAVQTVHVLLPEDYCLTLIRTDLLMQGIHRQFDSASVQFDFIPDNDLVAYVKNLVGVSNVVREVVGVVAIRCPREVYRFLAESGLPAVLFGSLFPGDPVIPSVDRNAREAGHLLTQYLIDRGHRQMALLTGADGWPGDNDFLGGVSQAITEAQLSHDALIIRIIPHDDAIFSATVKQLLALPDSPTGFIARGLLPAEMIAHAVTEFGRAMPDDIEVVFQDNATTETQKSPFVHVQTVMQFEDVMILLGKMLHDVSKGVALKSNRVAC